MSRFWAWMCRLPASLRDVESLVVVRCAIAAMRAALSVFQRMIGCIYLDSTNAANRFQEDHLQLMAAVAGISAVALDNARRLQWLEQENQRLTTEIRQEQSLVGESARIKEIFQFMARVAPTDSTVLIEGESGTGKELAARALHRNSHRASKPFVAINCAAIPETLAGDRFVRARARSIHRSGRAEKGAGWKLPTAELFSWMRSGNWLRRLQVKLLRVLQEREFERVGGTHPIKIDVRLIAATNRDLDEAVRKGEFRQDLYYRLAVVKLTMPSLRDQQGRHSDADAAFHPETCEAVQSEDQAGIARGHGGAGELRWPGNVRELENAIERALVMGSSEMIAARGFAGIAAGAVIRQPRCMRVNITRA